MKQLICLFSLLLATSPGFSSSSQAAENGLDRFVVDLPQDIDVERVQLKYFLYGPFGGYGDFRFEKAGAHRIMTL
jgi:hypothetical protein